MLRRGQGMFRPARQGLVHQPGGQRALLHLLLIGVFRFPVAVVLRVLEQEV